jgi:hypothetical protein
MNLRQIMAHARAASVSGGGPAASPGGPPTPQIYVQGVASLGEVCVFILAGPACTGFATIMLQPPKSIGVMTFANDVDFTSGGIRYLGWGYSLIDPDQGDMAWFFGKEPVDDKGTYLLIAADTAKPYAPGDPPPWDPAQAISCYRLPL